MKPAFSLRTTRRFDRLARALADARQRTLGIYAHLDLARLEVPCLPIVNPPLWELAHIAWFQEHWCLRQRPGGARAASNRPRERPTWPSASSAVPTMTRRFR